jgi:chaperone BCS1
MSIIINKHNLISYKIISRYIGHNIYYYTQTKNSDLIDKNIKNIKYEDGNIKFNLEGFNIKSKGLTNIIMNMNQSKFTLVYNLSDNKYNSNNESNSDNETKLIEDIVKYNINIQCMEHDDVIYNYHEYEPMTTIKITPLDSNSAQKFNIFISYIYRFVKTKIDNLSINDEDLKIYCNDDSYWDELQTKNARAIDTVYLPKKIKSEMIEDLNWFLNINTVERYKKMGRTHKRVYLFEGVPGSGKTTFISALASKFGYDIAMISFNEKVNDGKLLRLIRTLPEKTFLVLEDIDCLFEERKKNDGFKNTITFSGILNSLDGIATPDNFICFMTTNYKCNLDSALLRPGRIDKIIKFEDIKNAQIKEIYKVYMDKEYTDELFNEFIKQYMELNIKAPVALIQEYLFKYLDNPIDALENIDEIKDIFNSCYKNKTELYT